MLAAISGTVVLCLRSIRTGSTRFIPDKGIFVRAFLSRRGVAQLNKIEIIRIFRESPAVTESAINSWPLMNCPAVRASNSIGFLQSFDPDVSRGNRENSVDRGRVSFPNQHPRRRAKGERDSERCEERSANGDALGITKCSGCIYKYIFRNAERRGEMIDDFIVNAILKIPGSRRCDEVIQAGRRSARSH